LNFDKAFHFLLQFEGGYVDDKNDPGGKTKYGITEAVARANGYKGEMINFTIEEAKKIYRKNYWDSVELDTLPSILRYPLFDAAVNSGVSQSIKWLQRSLKVKADGVWGPATKDAVLKSDSNKVFREIINQRLNFLTDLKTFSSFGKGWVKRVSKILTL
jgi:lysozyme family protein